MPIKRLTFRKRRCNLCAPSRPAEGQARRRRGNLMERTLRFAPSRCQVLRGPVCPPEDGCGTSSRRFARAAMRPLSGMPRAPRWFPRHRNAPMSLVESQARQATSTPRFQSAGYVPEPPARAAGAALRDHVDLMLPMRHAGVRSVRIAFEAVGAAGAPVVLVAGGISAHRHVAASAQFPEAGWANDLVAAGRALDPAHHRILAFDYVGADGTLDAPIDPAD